MRFTWLLSPIHVIRLVQMMKDISGKVAVITGGGGLLGRGMAIAFAREGMDIVLADLNEEAANKVADEIRALGRNVLVVGVDVTDPAAVESLADQAYAAFGQTNVLCNNTGKAILRPFEELTLDDWQLGLGANLMGVIHGVHAFLPRMIAQEGDAHIVNTSSMSGVGRADLRHENATYVTSKFAVVGLTESMAPALEKYGIGVSVLCPGMTVADPTQPLAYKMPSAEWYRDNLLGPEDIALEVICGIRENRLHIFPHRAGLGEVEGRHVRILEGFRQAASTSPILGKYKTRNPT